MKYFSEFLNTWSGCNTCYQFNWPFTCITSFLNKISMVDGRENFPINFYAPVKKRWFICIFHFASFHPLFLRADIKFITSLPDRTFPVRSRFVPHLYWHDYAFSDEILQSRFYVASKWSSDFIFASLNSLNHVRT